MYFDQIYSFYYSFLTLLSPPLSRFNFEGFEETENFNRPIASNETELKIKFPFKKKE
jgi:hypothetical protein